MKHIILLFVIFFMANSIQAEILFIANKSVSEKKLTISDIKSIFLGNKKRWSDDTLITFVISGDEYLHETFLKTYIKKSVNQYNAYWKNMLFTGRGVPPKRISTTKETIKYIADTEGAIGYIDDSATPVNVNTISVE